MKNYEDVKVGGRIESKHSGVLYEVVFKNDDAMMIRNGRSYITVYADDNNWLRMKERKYPDWVYEFAEGVPTYLTENTASVYLSEAVQLVMEGQEPLTWEDMKTGVQYTTKPGRRHAWTVGRTDVDYFVARDDEGSPALVRRDRFAYARRYQALPRWMTTEDPAGPRGDYTIGFRLQVACEALVKREAGE